MTGFLTLVVTPIDDRSVLDPCAKEILLQAVANPQQSVVCVEEIKEGRRRWIRFGLPRHFIEHLLLYNEQTESTLCVQLEKELLSGKNVYLMSDAGLPAFCDPGQKLVDLCHRRKIRVTATPCGNSVALAVALSGYPTHPHVFEGFLPANREQRDRVLARLVKESRASVFLETPYRLKSVLKALEASTPDREVFLALDLNEETETLLRDVPTGLLRSVSGKNKKPVLVLSPRGGIRGTP